MPNSRDGSNNRIFSSGNGRGEVKRAIHTVGGVYSFFSEHPLIIVGRQHANDIMYARQDGRRRHYKRFSITVQTTNYKK